MDEPLLQVRRLSVRFGRSPEYVHAVRDVSFSLGREKLGIVGESGSGKSTLGRTILGLQPASASVTAERLSFDGIDLLGTDKRRLRGLRGRRISMIMQDPKFSLNPVMNVGEQIDEAYRIHHDVTRREARRRTLEMLGAVRIQDPERVCGLYPHQISGGMGQRVMIAMMLIPEPDLIIADEPTSALDVTVRLQVLAILDDLARQHGTAMIFISHDLALVRSFCDFVLIMYAGRVVETLRAVDLDHARHPYTRGLLAAMPDLANPDARLQVMQRDPAWALPDG